MEADRRLELLLDLIEEVTVAEFRANQLASAARLPEPHDAHVEVRADPTQLEEK